MIKVTCDFCGQRAVGKLTRLVERMDSEFPIRDDLDICNDCFEAAQQYVQRTADKRRVLLGGSRSTQRKEKRCIP